MLVLDEPTNDLDIETLELLESLLVDYQGTVLLVSHDRAFLNNVVTSTLVIENDGQVKEFEGGYDDYLRQSPPAPAPGRGPVAVEHGYLREKDARRFTCTSSKTELQGAPGAGSHAGPDRTARKHGAGAAPCHG